MSELGDLMPIDWEAVRKDPNLCNACARPMKDCIQSESCFAEYATEELKRLRAENERLRQELKDTIEVKNKVVQDKFEHLAENERLVDLIADCWNQWCYRGTVGGKEVWTDGGLSTLEALRATLVQAGRIDDETGKALAENKEEAPDAKDD
jgi:hypothetical protein